VPLSLVRTGIKLSTMLPPKVSVKLNENGIDLSQLSKLEATTWCRRCASCRST
jgi:hypothetical protein